MRTPQGISTALPAIAVVECASDKTHTASQPPLPNPIRLRPTVRLALAAHRALEPYSDAQQRRAGIDPVQVAEGLGSGYHAMAAGVAP